MRRYAFVMILMSFVVMAIFGFAGMAGGHGHQACIASTAQGVARCFSGNGESAADFFHINVYKTFSLAIVSGAVIGVIWLVRFYNMTGTMQNTDAETHRGFSPNGRVAFAYVNRYTQFRVTVLNWLALHALNADEAVLHGA